MHAHVPDTCIELLYRSCIFRCQTHTQQACVYLVGLNFAFQCHAELVAEARCIEAVGALQTKAEFKTLLRVAVIEVLQGLQRVPSEFGIEWGRLLHVSIVHNIPAIGLRLCCGPKVRARARGVGHARVSHGEDDRTKSHALVDTYGSGITGALVRAWEALVAGGIKEGRAAIHRRQVANVEDRRPFNFLVLCDKLERTNTLDPSTLMLRVDAKHLKF